MLVVSWQKKKRTLLQYLSVAEVPCTCIINGLCSKIRMSGLYIFSQRMLYFSRVEMNCLGQDIHRKGSFEAASFHMLNLLMDHFAIGSQHE